MANEPQQSIEAATTAQTFAVLLGAATTMANVAQTELDTTGRSLTQEGPLWSQTGVAIHTMAESFKSASGELMQGWTSKREAPIFASASDATQSAMVNSAAAIDGIAPNGPSEARGTIEQMCTDLVRFMTSNQASAQTAVDTVTEAQKKFQALYPHGTTVVQGQGQMVRVPATAEEAAAVQAVRPAVLAVGGLLTTQNTSYESIGRQILDAAQQLKWVGPTGEASAPGGSPGGPSGQQAGGGGQPPGGEQAGGEQAGGEQAGGEQAGGEQAGGEQAGGEQAGGGDQAGAEQPGGAEQPPGGELPTGPGLAGSQTLTPPPLTGVPMVPGSNMPMPSSSPPVGMPLAPITPGLLSPAANNAVRIPTGGIGGGGIGGGIGKGGIGGGIGTGGIGGLGKQAELGKPTGGLVNGEQQIAQAAKMPPAAPVGSGQAPALPTGTGSGTAGPAGAGGGGAPPMMPPMGGGMGGAGNSGGKPGSGAIRAGGRERKRLAGATPGVPEGLQGKSGRPASFQAAAKPQRRGKAESDTLEVLDDELWTVDTPDAAPAAPKPVRRLAH